MGSRSRILFMGEGVTLAHVVRPFVLAKALDGARYDVHFACPDGYEFVWKGSAFPRWAIHSQSSELFKKNLAHAKAVYDYSTLRRYVEEDRELLRRLRPQMVVGDFRLSLAVSAALEKVRYVAIANAYWSPFSKSNYRLVEHPAIPYVGKAVGDLAFKIVRPIGFYLHAGPLNRLRKENGLSSLGNVLNAYTYGDHVLFADPPELVPVKALPAHCEYLGPVLWSPGDDWPEGWEMPPSDLPRIYLTLGSSGKTESLRVILSALRDVPCHVLWAAAGCPIPENIPPRVRWNPYLPGQLAARESALVISNGGSGTVYQALSEGKPVLGLCANMDQLLTMDGVVNHGAGLMLGPYEVTAARVRSAVMELLGEPRYREAALRIAHTFRKYSATDRFRSFIERTLDSRSMA